MENECLSSFTIRSALARLLSPIDVTTNSYRIRHTWSYKSGPSSMVIITVHRSDETATAATAATAMRFHGSGVLKQYRDPDISTKNSIEIECTQKNARINTAYQATNFRYTELVLTSIRRNGPLTSTTVVLLTSIYEPRIADTFSEPFCTSYLIYYGPRNILSTYSTIYILSKLLVRHCLLVSLSLERRVHRSNALVLRYSYTL
jgi:hypothetical protein